MTKLEMENMAMENYGRAISVYLKVGPLSSGPVANSLYELSVVSQHVITKGHGAHSKNTWRLSGQVIPVLAAEMLLKAYPVVENAIKMTILPKAKRR